MKEVSGVPALRRPSHASFEYLYFLRLLCTNLIIVYCILNFADTFLLSAIPTPRSCFTRMCIRTLDCLYLVIFLKLKEKQIPNTNDLYLFFICFLTCFSGDHLHLMTWSSSSYFNITEKLTRLYTVNIIQVVYC